MILLVTNWSSGSFVLNGANHASAGISTYPFAIFGGDWSDAMKGKTYPIKGNTVIGNDVWIGYGATIMPGVHIGHGAIIGTKAIVTKDVSPYSIVGGNPAKLIKKRFSEEEIALLLDIAWWDWELEKITQHVQDLTSGNVESLIKIRDSNL